MEFLKQNRNVFLISCALLVAFMQILIPLPIPVPLNYIFMIYACYIALTSLEDMKLNIGCALMLGATMISIMGNNIPDFFKPWPRFALFAMLVLGCSPIFNGPKVNRLKRQMTMGGLWACFIISMWSFVVYFTGQGLYITGFVNGYMGVTGHPNFLGYYVMVTMAGLASLYFRCTKPKERIIIGVCWASCIVTLLVSASRSATGLGLVGSLIAAYLRLQKDAARRYRLVMIMACATVMALPYLLPYTETMMKKEMNFDDGGEAALAATRGYIWELRMMENAKSPVIGVGAYACDITLPEADVFYDEKNGTIELGSSYLGMLAQIGWLGFLSFLLIAIPIVWKTIRYCFVERTPYAQFFFPILAISGVHMAFEGYLMTAGAVQSVIVWMVLGACDQCDTVADYPVAWEKSDPITPEQYEMWRENIAEDGDKR